MKKLKLMKFALVLSLFLAAATGAFAQQTIRVSGKVTDQRDEPVIAATIEGKKGKAITISDVEGNYSINVLPNDTLIVSFMGHLTREIPVNSQSVVNVELQENNKLIDEVVVVGYGQQKKVNLTGAVEVIKSDAVAKRASGQLSSMLQGLAPGVTVTQNSGQPGKDMGDIRIRGIGTINKASPLTIIDDIEGDINSIDPQMIESISVLKDAASSAIYGSRAANGVILIKTKRAKEEGVTINYNGYVGFQIPTELPQTVNAVEHMTYLNEAYRNSGKTPLYTDAYIQTYRDSMGVSKNLSLYPNTDWKRELLRGSGFQQNHFLSLMGGGKNVKVASSVGYFDQKGIIRNTGFTRYNFRINTDIKLSNRMKARIDTRVTYSNMVEPVQTIQTIFRTIPSYPANYVFKNTDGTWGEGWNNQNPVADVEEGGTTTAKNILMSINAGLNYEILEGLSIDVNYSPSFNPEYIHKFSTPVQKYNASGKALAKSVSYLDEVANRAFFHTFKALLNFNKSIKGHNISAMVGYQADYSNLTTLGAFRDDFTIPTFDVIDAGNIKNQRTSGTAYEYSLLSLFGRVNYDYQGKYLFEANIRRDGTSRFAQDSRFATFPSLSVGWRMSEEDFMQNMSDVVSNLKLRGSWGILGNQSLEGLNSYYPTKPTMNFTTGSTAYLFNGIQNLGAALTQLANEELRWEQTEMIDFGVDLQLFSKLSVSFDWYKKVTSNVLMQLDVPLTMGLLKPYQNAGKIENIGWELSIGYNTYFGKDFSFGINVGISDVMNKVLDMKLTSTSLLVNKEGYALNSLWGYEAAGLFGSQEEINSWATQFGALKPGDIKYVKQNTNNNQIGSDDEKIIGSTIPRFTYNAMVNMAWKGLDLNFLLQGVGKCDGYISTYGIMPFYNGSTIQYQHLDRYTEENKNVDAAFPRFTDGLANNIKNSSFWVKDASYLRLKNLQIGYTLPQATTRKVGVSKLRFNVSAQNLLTLTNFWKGYDVEAPVTDGGFYPQVKTITLGIDLSF